MHIHVSNDKKKPAVTIHVLETFTYSLVLYKQLCTVTNKHSLVFYHLIIIISKYMSYPRDKPLYLWPHIGMVQLSVHCDTINN